MKYEIMLKILFYLLSRGKTSAAALASRFEISVRTVMRYIDEISLAGIPIIADAGRSGGYYIADSYKITDGFMSEEEFDALLTAANACNEQLREKNLSSAIDKLRSVYRPNKLASELKAGNFLIDFTGWNGDDNVKEVVGVLDDAIENGKVVNMGYMDKNGNTSSRLIDPHVLILKQGLWYVYAYCHTRNEFRTFKLSRILYASSTNENFVRREVDPNVLKNANWLDKAESEFVDLKISAAALNDVEEWLGVKNVYKNSDGSYGASAKLPVDEWLIAKLTGYGGKVKIIAPEKLKREVKARAEEILSVKD